MSKDFTYTVKKEQDSTIAVDVKVTLDRFNSAKEQTYTKLAPTVKISGFRPGKAPKSQIEAKLGADLLNETLKELLADIAAEIVETENLNPLTNLEYDITKTGGTDGVNYTFTFVNYPEVKVGDFKKLKVDKEVKPVNQADVDGVLSRIFPTDEKDEKEEGKSIKDKIKDLNIPDVTTEKELRTHVEERLKQLNDSDGDRVYEQKLVEAAVKASEVKVPEKLIHEQAHAMVHDYMHRLEDLNVDVNDFLEAQGTSHDKLLEDYKEDAELRVATDLIMNEIVKNNDLIPSSEDIEEQLNLITDDQVKQSYDSYAGRRQILSVLIHQRGLAHLKEVVGEPKIVEMKSESKPEPTPEPKKEKGAKEKAKK